MNAQEWYLSKGYRMFSPEDEEALFQVMEEFRAASPPQATGTECEDCNKAARHAYSDATTPGFFDPRCAKHRVPQAHRRRNE